MSCARCVVLVTYFPRSIRRASYVVNREDYDIVFFLNILMIFQREYNRVLVPTPGCIEQSQLDQSTQKPD